MSETVAESAELTTAELAAFVRALRSPIAAADDTERVDRLRLLEELKSVAAAAQAIETRDLAASQRAVQAAADVPAAQQGRSIAAQVALARRISPWQAQRYVGWCAVLTRELPKTFDALLAGRITEWRAMLVARETIWLSQEDRAEVDAELGPRLEDWGDRRVEAEARKAAYRLDPAGWLERIRGAERDRRVTVRPAPYAMARLTALLPVAQGVAAYAALCRTADSVTAAGDDRGRGQIMADTLVERLTGQAIADAVPVEIALVMTDHTLLNTPGDDRAGEPAVLDGCGPIPAELARALALTAPAPRWLRRLFTSPTTGELVAMDSKSRTFTAGQRRFLRYRDQTCRTPWCDAGIAHTDHVLAHGLGGATDVGNGQGLCRACNHAKQAPGWSAAAWAGQAVTTTPTGHVYRSRAPDPPGADPDASVLERRVRSLLAVA